MFLLEVLGQPFCVISTLLSIFTHTCIVCMCSVFCLRRPSSRPPTYSRDESRFSLQTVLVCEDLAQESRRNCEWSCFVWKEGCLRSTAPTNELLCAPTTQKQSARLSKLTEETVCVSRQKDDDYTHTHTCVYFVSGSLLRRMRLQTRSCLHPKHTASSSQQSPETSADLHHSTCFLKPTGPGEGRPDNPNVGLTIADFSTFHTIKCNWKCIEGWKCWGWV